MVKKQLKLYIILVAAAIIVALVVAALTFFSLSGIYQQILIKRADKAIEKVIQNVGNELVDYKNRYTSLEPNPETGSFDLVRGHGLNLMLLSNSTNKSYIHEYLQIMVDNQNGAFIARESDGSLKEKFIPAPFELTLPMAVNEAGYYPSSGMIPRSLLPFINGEVIWNQEYQGYPAEAMTLRKLNKTMNRVPFTSYLLTGTYKNIFQIDGSYFSDGSFTSGVQGYGMSPNRYYPDSHFLPDSLNYINQNLYKMRNDYKIPDDDLTTRAMYAVYHNAGEGTMSYYVTYGVTGNNKLKSTSYKNDDYLDLVSGILKRYEDFAKEVDTYKYHSSSTKGYAKAFWLYYKDGYYIDNKLYNKLKAGGTEAQYIRSSYEVLEGKSLSQQAFIDLIKDRVREPWEVGYVDFPSYNSVYGDIRDSPTHNKGSFFKFSNDTSSAYKGKVNGQDPRILIRMNYEVAGYVWDSLYAGKYLYAELMKLAGENIDPTNPSSYYESLENEYIPQPGDFGDILKRLGVKIEDQRIYDMLAKGYEYSGNWYFYGGAAKIVNEENYSFFVSQQKTYDSPIIALKQLYATKDGSDPSIKHNRRNENLVNYGKFAFDCSSFVYYVYNNTLKGPEESNLILSSTGFYHNTSHTHKINFKDRKAGDLFVREGHIFFYLAEGSASKASLTLEESKTEMVMVSRPGSIWSLEAAESGTRVGIRSRSMPKSSVYILKRFNKLR